MATSISSNAWLDWTERLNDQKKFIDQAFERLTRSTKSAWNAFNGQSFYGLCGVNEHTLLKKIIVQAYPKQKEFYVLDVGAGNFQWSEAVAQFIEAQPELPKDIKVHIIGVRGESYFGQRIVETERCKIYNLGAFKVEELFAQFKKQGLDLENKVDLAVSHWCFRHLVDPVGTFAQLYNLLRPGSGHMLVDGFFFATEKDKNLNNGDINMTRLFLDTKAPFLTKYCGSLRSLNHFMLRRPDDVPCRLPMRYLDTFHPDGELQIGSGIVTRFKREPQECDEEKFFVPEYSYRRDVSVQIYGDKTLFDGLKKNQLFEDPCISWKPIQEKDRPKETPAIHRAILEGKYEQVEECLERGGEIDETDSAGCTALHLSIQRRAQDLFKLLLDHGANLEIYSAKGHTPLHEAAVHDTEGVFVQTLIDAGAKISSGKKIGKTPLSCAIKEKNVQAVEVLMKNNAEVLERDERDLKRLLSPRQPLPPLQKSTGLQEVMDWIKQGEYVVLHQQGYSGIVYHYPNPENPNPKLMIADINPQFPLLDKEEWPRFLEFAGYKSAPYDREKIYQINFPEIIKYRFAYGT